MKCHTKSAALTRRAEMTAIAAITVEHLGTEATDAMVPAVRQWLYDHGYSEVDDVAAVSESDWQSALEYVVAPHPSIPTASLVVIEDNAGGLWLWGTTEQGEAVHYGDLAYSNESGVAELVTAYHEGIAGWEHGQGNDQPLCNEPFGFVIAEYDGMSLTLHTHKMGHAGSEYFVGKDGAAALR